MLVQNLLKPERHKLCLVTKSEAVTFGDLYDRVCRMATQLRPYKKRPVLLIFHPDDAVGFTVAFYACLMTGAIAVPTPPTNYQTIQKDCEAAAIVTSWTMYFALFEWSTTFIIERRCGCCVSRAGLDDPEPDDIAFLQYTSGSTSSPRGVVISHKALEANIRWVTEQYLGNINDVVSVTWVPFYHDYGLTSILNINAVGGTLHYLSPLQFMKDPLSWIRRMSQVRATHTQAPNFAYGLCARHAALFPPKDIDLSCVRQFSMGGEIIRRKTMERFTTTFKVSMEQMDPSYGMAEMVCGIVHCQGGSGPLEMHGIVNVGTIGKNVEVRIMDDDEVWVRGESMMSGYYRRPNQEQYFGELEGKRWVRTGDLGFIHQGCLFIKGRKKDVIILNGRNIVSTDVEWIVEKAFPGLRPGSIAAVPIYEKEEEKLGLIAEVRDPKAVPSEKDIRYIVYKKMEVPVHRVLFVPKRTLPKTSSGKLQRFKCRKFFEE